MRLPIGLQGKCPHKERLYMRKLTFIFPICMTFIILAVVLVFMCLPLGQTHGEAAGGTLDLRASDIAGSIYQLTGEWQITPDRLVGPETFPDDAPCLMLPNNWGGADSRLNCCATYRLVIFTDETRQLALYIPEIYTAYRLYINGEFVRGAGVVSETAEEGKPSFESVIVPVRAADGKVEIVVQASNYHWMRPHMNNVLKLSESDSMNSWFFRTRTIYVLAMGFILAAAFYHFVLYVMRRKMTVNLLFSLLSLLCFWRLALETDGLSDFTGWFSMATGVLDARIYLLLFFLHSACIAAFSLYVFDRQWLTRYYYWAIAWCAVFTVAFSLLPMNVSWLTPIFSVATGLPMMLAFYKALRSKALKGSKLNWLYIIAMLLYIFVGFFSKYLADHLLYMTPVLTNMYMIMAESIILARQYSDTVAREQELVSRTAVMEQSAKVRSYMIDTLSHEVRTPLTVMSSYAQLAAERIDEGVIDDVTLANLKKISEESKRLADLASNTLRLSRLSDIPDSGGFIPIDVGELAGQVTRLFEPMAIKNRRELIVELPGNPPPVLGSADSLTRLTWNLLDNALTHGEHGSINISVSEDAGKVRLVVKDHGVGVRPEILKEAFSYGVSGRYDGTGIGLSMCRDIAREMDGEITIESVPHEGTTVTVTLPGAAGS